MISLHLIVAFSLAFNTPAQSPDTVDNTTWIPVLVYHHIGPEEGRWTRTPEGLRNDLELLHERGFRPVHIEDLVRGTYDLPPGTAPVAITFDDASPGQFRWTNDGDVDPRSAVGILEAFASEHPAWAGGATFCLLSAAEAGNAFFGDERSDVAPEDRRRKIAFLRDNGYELCNHTWWHGRLDQRDPDTVREQIGRGQLAIDSIAPDAAGRVFALPLGMWPERRELAIRGEWVSPAGDTARWDHVAVLLGGSDITESPAHPQFDPHAIQRIQVIRDNLESILDRLERAGRYVIGLHRSGVAATSDH